MSDSFSPPPPDSPLTASAGPVAAARRRRLIAVVSLVLLGVAGAAGWYLWHASTTGTPVMAGPGGPGGPGGPPRVTPVVVEAASNENFPVRLSAIGTVIPRTVVTVRSRVDGTLNRINFEEGQTVRAGDLLAEIDPRPYEVALTQVQGQMSRDEALLANARADLERYEGLARLDAIPSQQLDTQRALVRQYEAAVKMDQGAVDNARLQLSYTRITAPADGRAGLRQVDPGNLVRASDANGIVVITQVQPVTVVFPIPEADLGKLLPRLGLQTPAAGGKGAARSGQRQGRGEAPAAPGGKARLAVEAWDREGRALLATGELLTLDNQLDVTTGTVKVKAIFPNQDGALFPNQFVNVRLVVNELKDAVVIPAAAVQRGARGAFVWLLGTESTVAMRPVEAGAADGDRVPVLRGLQSGDRVAVDGFDRLRDGAKVEVVSRESRAVKEASGKRNGRRGGPGHGAGGPGAAPASAATPAVQAQPAAAPASTPAGVKPQP